MNAKNRSAHLAVVWLASLGALSASGCSNNFRPASLVNHARVLGARIEVLGDPTRSNPRPGESATVRWLVGFPAEEQTLSWAFLTCVPEATSYGVPQCAHAVGAPALQLEPALGAPHVELAIPNEATLGDANQLLMLGSICAQDQVNTDPTVQAACANPDGDGTIVTLRVPIERDGMTNHNPSLDAVTLNDEVLDYMAAPDAPGTGCAGGDAPQIVWSEDVVALALTAVDGSRETYTVNRGAPPVATDVLEDLLVEDLSTAGEIDLHFAYFDDLNPTIDLEWTLPALAEVAADGTLVRLTFTMRDGRGGFDFIQRAVCVVAP